MSNKVIHCLNLDVMTAGWCDMNNVFILFCLVWLWKLWTLWFKLKYLKCVGLMHINCWGGGWWELSRIMCELKFRSVAVFSLHTCSYFYAHWGLEKQAVSFSVDQLHYRKSLTFQIRNRWYYIYISFLRCWLGYSTVQADGSFSNSYTDDRKSAYHQYFWSKLQCKYISFLHSWQCLQKGNQSERRWDCVLKFFPLEVGLTCSELIAGFISDMWQETPPVSPHCHLVTCWFTNKVCLLRWMNWGQIWRLTPWETRHNNQSKCCYYFITEKYNQDEGHGMKNVTTETI